MRFSKYHGTGNDFILINNMTSSIALSIADVQRLCNRHHGIGADGLILLNNSSIYDFEMIYYNSDGSSNVMCGNGSRCIVAFAHHLGIIQSTCTFLAYDGLHHAFVISDDNHECTIKTSMKDCSLPKQLDENTFFIDTGAPHLVSFCRNVNSLDVTSLGLKLSNDARLKERSNVNFVEIEGDNLIVRTFERGVEAETLSCGTGITASVLSYIFHCPAKNKDHVVKVSTLGGSLSVFFQQTTQGFRQIFLEGKATFVFQGEIPIYLPDAIPYNIRQITI